LCRIHERENEGKKKGPLYRLGEKVDTMMIRGQCDRCSRKVHHSPTGNGFTMNWQQVVINNFIKIVLSLTTIPQW
ncbi:MAG: hypothetical protein AB7U43_07815, partial [Desulfobacter sp.]